MAQATTTSPGTIVLAGDLTGGSAYAPQLSPTGVQPVSNKSMYRKMYVDSKGRTIWISPDPLELPVFGIATRVSPPGEIIAGETLQVEGGELTFDPAVITEADYDKRGVFQLGGGFENVVDYLIKATDATEETKGIITPSIGLSVSNGITDVDFSLQETSSTTSKGLVQIGYGYAIDESTLHIPDATTSSKGAVQVGDGLSIVNGTLSIPDATTSSKGIVQINTVGGLAISNGVLSLTQEIYLPDASESVKGEVQVGTGLSVSEGILKIDLPDASTTDKGDLLVGDGFSSNSGILSADTSSDIIKGIVRVGVGFDILDGILNGTTATLTTKGLVKVGYGIIPTNGIIDIDLNLVPIASYLTSGLVKGSTDFPVNNGIISSTIIRASGGGYDPDDVYYGAGNVSGSNYGSVRPYPLPSYGAPYQAFDIADGTLSIIPTSFDNYGAVKAHSDINMRSINIQNGEIYKTIASLTSIGLVRQGSGIIIDSEGVASIETSTIPTATTTTKGVVQVGDGLSVSAGVISSEQIATTTTKGLVQIGDGLSVNSGVISAPYATTSSKGFVQIGGGLEVIDGVVNFTGDASEISKGQIQVGSGLSVSAGNLSRISIPATTTSLGDVQINENSSISVYNGVISISDATTSSKGIVQVGDGLSVNSGVISIPDATTSSKGKVQVGNGLTVSNGTLSIDTVNNLATSVNYGFVKVSSDLNLSKGLYISVSDYLVINSDYVDAATTTSKGVVKIGDGIGVNLGTIVVRSDLILNDVPTTDVNTHGKVKVSTGNGLLNSPVGTLSIDTTSTTNIGTMQVGNNLSISGDVLSVNEASLSNTYLTTSDVFYQCSKAIWSSSPAQVSYNLNNTSQINSLTKDYVEISTSSGNISVFPVSPLLVTNYIFDIDNIVLINSWDSSYRFPSSLPTPTQTKTRDSFTVINNGTKRYFFREYSRTY